MGKVIKKCLACGTLNQYDAKTCKKCECPLLADVDQEDEILGIDPMEAALDDAVQAQEDDVVAQILREQAENAKKIVAKEKEIEERRQKRLSRSTGTSRFGVPSEGGGSSFGFSLGGEGRSVAPQRTGTASAGRSMGGSGGFRISNGEYQVRDENAPGQVNLGGGALRMQAIRQNQTGQGGEAPDKKKKKK